MQDGQAALLVKTLSRGNVARMRSGARKHYNVRPVLVLRWNALCMGGAAGDCRTIHNGYSCTEL